METEAEKIGPRVGRFSAGAERSRTLSTACEPGGGRARPQISVGGRRGSWSVFIVKFRIRSGVGVELERRPQCNAIISQSAGWETFSLRMSLRGWFRHEAARIRGKLGGLIPPNALREGLVK